MRRALVHLKPKIDQFTIFENRIVEAGLPQPWPTATDYGTCRIDERYRDRFEELETVAFLIIRDDSLLFEQYWDGYGPASYSNSFSMAKSIVSMMVGAAIADGYVKGTDQPVADFLPWIEVFDGRVMTIEDLLTMSAGIRWDEGYSGIISPTTKAYYGKDLRGQVAGLKQVSRPGYRTVYQSGVTQMLGQILSQATGKTLSEYASQKLWIPIGAEYDALWSLDHPGGMEKAYCCFNSNARDFARFGKLMLQRGSWNGKELVPQWYMDKAMAPATWLLSEYGDSPNVNYGYQFWILERDGMQIPYMRGILGQYVFALPEYNAVIVRLGRKRSEVRTDQNYPDDIDTWLDAGLEILTAGAN
ncbi:MAG: beta-lactamase family protein [Alistipes sp.]|nr:beta-lactamase family protein [Alistipes sp.]